MYFVNMALGCTHEEVSFVFLDDLDNISALLDEDNDLQEEIIILKVRTSNNERSRAVTTSNEQ